jgi:hypothetical protein
MRPLPPKNRLEFREAHAAVEEIVLGALPVEIKGVLPRRLAEWRDDTGDGLPFGYGEAGFGQPGRAADQHHYEDEQDEEAEPEPHPGMRARARPSGALRGNRNCDHLGAPLGAAPGGNKAGAGCATPGREHVRLPSSAASAY